MRVKLTIDQRRAIRLVARTSSLSACLIFAVLAVLQGPPQPPEGPGLERDIQYAFVFIGLFAALIAWRETLPGGFLLVITGVVLGVAAAMRYKEETGLFIALLFVVPGSLFLLLWVSGRWLALQLLTLLLVIGLMAYGGTEARARHARAFGPAHPQSTTAKLRVDKVEWLWTGAVNPAGATVKARLVNGAASARLAVSESGSLAAIYSPAQTPVSAQGNVVALTIGGLRPGTRYYFGLEVDGVIDEAGRGSFRTFPAGPASFSVVVSSCARTGSNGTVFDAIRAEDALLFIIAGDFHYANIDRDDITSFRRAYAAALTAPAQAALYRQTPIAHVWDDHDFAGNNSNARSAARKAARLSYREQVPHYGLPAGERDAAIYQAFTAGRVRFVMTDSRSERDAERLPSGAPRLLGGVQLAWLKRELLESSRSHGLVVWVNPLPWIAPAISGRDDWGGYAEERTEIADFIAANGINNLLMLSGDAHMLGIDDGSNSDYARSGDAGFPVFQAAALDRPGSIKGGPYSHGIVPGAGQYGLVTFTDNGGAIAVQFSGRDWQRQELISYSFSLPR